ncbi:MAG: hypothetical protein U0172_11315 [Nitrospiraceae bacterium]
MGGDDRSSASSARRVVQILFSLLCVFLLVACHRPWRDIYFDKGLHQLTQDDVQEKLGPPHTMRNLVLGEESIWSYRIPLSEDDMDSWNGMGKTAAQAGASAAAIVGQGQETSKYPTLRCQKYTLKFDKNKILQDWKRESCVPPTTPAS